MYAPLFEAFRTENFLAAFRAKDEAFILFDGKCVQFEFAAKGISQNLF